MAFKKWVENIQTAAYNVVSMYSMSWLKAKFEYGPKMKTPQPMSC